MKKTKACVIIFNKDGNLLLQLRDEEPEKGKWVLFGGSVEEGEEEMEAAKRELKEELGYEFKNMHFFRRYENNNIEQPIFVAEDLVELGDLSLQEGGEMNFFSTKEIPFLDIGFNFKEIILDYLREKGIK